MPFREVRIGTAGWSIPKEQADRFSDTGSHLERYSQRLSCVEINSSFYRPHRPSTYARWASETPETFAFSVKVPKEVTHIRRLVHVDEPLDRFLDESAELGAKRGPLLVQLPPSLKFDVEVVTGFFKILRHRYSGPLACEPRHRTWFTGEADRLLAEYETARVAADPAVSPIAAEPGGWTGLVYYRLHGSPEMYYSPYSAEYLEDLAEKLAEMRGSQPTWCIFDNTALGAATKDAFCLYEYLDEVFTTRGEA